MIRAREAKSRNITNSKKSISHENKRKTYINEYNLVSHFLCLAKVVKHWEQSTRIANGQKRR